MKILFFTFALFFPLFAFSQPPSIVWQKSLGGSLYDKAMQVIETYDGGYAIAGYSQSNDFDVLANQGGFDFWILKVDFAGNFVWKYSLGSYGEEQAIGITETTSHDLVVAGHSNSYLQDFSSNYGQNDIILIKLNSLGDLIWKKNYGGAENDFCRSIIKTSDGNLVIAGNSESNDVDVLGNHGFSDCWVVMLDVGGNIMWQKSIGGTDIDYATTIHQTQDNGFILAGNSQSNLVGNYGDLDGYIVKLDGLGNIEWQKNCGGSLADYLQSIIEAKDGSFWAVGETYSSDYDAISNHSNTHRDYFVIKMDANGNTLWSKCYGGSVNDYARSIIQTTDENFVIAGEGYSNDGDITFSYGSAEYWLIKINSSGDLIWQKTYGSSGHDEPNCILQTSDNGFVVVGNSQSQNDGDVTGNHGDDDIWVVKYKNEENCQSKLVLNKTILQGEVVFGSSTTIDSKVKVDSQTSNICYKAEKSILLHSGFEVKPGSVFKATIDGCD